MGIGKERQSTAEAYAKVNVHLHVGAPRGDGYHDIASIFQLVSLSDSITVSVIDSPFFSCHIGGVAGVPKESNTMFRAARFFCEASGASLNVHITCEKRIPSQAGLGGGSSDAATVLHLLNRLQGYPLAVSELQAISLMIGSDVPFFTTRLGCAFVEGKGERITALDARDDLKALIIMPTDFSHSTASLFNELDSQRLSSGVQIQNPSKENLCKEYALPCGKWTFKNDFRCVMGVNEKWYKCLEDFLVEYPKCFGTLSGSGAAFVVFIPRNERIEYISEKLRLNCHNILQIPTKCLRDNDSGDTLMLP
jgi:4-diphosphocytidyl-2-C-methyl-D-erythritol kinase